MLSCPLKYKRKKTPGKMESHGWSIREAQCLISIWSEDSVQRKLEDSYRNRAIYEEISKQMKGNGYGRSWQQCKRKIKHLKSTFRKAKDSNGKSGRQRISWVFYRELDRVLRDRTSSCPGEGEVLESKLDYTQADEPLSNSMMDATEDAAEDATPAESPEDDCQSDGMHLVWETILNCVQMRSTIYPQSCMNVVVLKPPFTGTAGTACATCAVHVYTWLFVY